MSIRRIAHLDMDAFYASVELLRYPQLKGLPVVIGGGKSAHDLAFLRTYAGCLDTAPLSAFARLKDYTGRGVITTATYEARAFGVGSALGLMKAAKLCPEAILLPVTFEEYRRYSKAFKEAVFAIAPVIEDRGVDEIYIDITHIDASQQDGGHSIALTLQQAVFNATGLTCSIGVAPNKLLAKMASEFNKPKGVSVIFESDIQSRIWPLPVRKINGIGPKTEMKLHAHGIVTIGDLAQHSTHFLTTHFGKSYGAWLHEAAHGIDHNPVQTHTEPVSMSRETTFERDLHAKHNRNELSDIFTKLCHQLAADLERKGYFAKTIGIKIKYQDYKSVTRDLTIDCYTQDAAIIRHAAGQCLKRIDLTRKFRLLGVKVSHLSTKQSFTDPASLPNTLQVAEPILDLFSDQNIPTNTYPSQLGTPHGQ